MVRFPNRKIFLLLIAAGCGLLAATSPLWAHFRLLAYSTQPIDGVDSKGNASASLGAESSGKIFKDRSTGVVLQINRAKVENELTRGKIFRNRGLTMFDPETFDKLTSTSDYTLVFVRTSVFQGTKDETGWGALEVKVYDPALVPVPVP